MRGNELEMSCSCCDLAWLVQKGNSYVVCLEVSVSHPSSATAGLEVAAFLAAFLACLPALISTLRSLACSVGSNCHRPHSNACKRESLSQPSLVRTSASIWDVSVQIAKASESSSYVFSPISSFTCDTRMRTRLSVG